MPCSEETLFWLFYNVSSSSLLLLLFVYFSSTLLLKLLNFIGSYPIILRNQNGYEYNFSDEEEEVDTETYYYTDPREKDHLVADIVLGGESLVFLSNTSITQRTQNHVQEFVNQRQSLKGEDNDDETSASDDEKFSVLASAGSESKYDDADPVVKEEEEEDMTTRDADSVFDSAPDHGGPTTPITTYRQKNGLMDSDKNYGEDYINQGIENKKMDTNFHGDEKFFVFAPTQFETKKLQVQEKDDEEIFGDSCTVGSTSKSSSEWRSSIKDSGTEDPFSSSSRRSCPKWESYTVFQKYDEEMTFLDRVSAQKLHETESLKSIQVNPRSISDRIVHKIATMNKKKPSDIRHNPYHELEAAYVAQICLTWEALNWNYKNFNSKRASQRDFDRGCPGHIAQQFQQFQVLLQRYVENEPYEQGRRPEVYARVRLLAPKLLLVPEYRDSEDDTNEEGFGSRISSAAFLMIMEDGIKTFMDFLKLDKQKPCQILSSFLRRNRRGSVDPALLQLMKKVNKKKKMKLKDLRRARKCIRKRKLKVEEEMEILMGLIDLKVVSRVLRMNDLSEEQLHWCEEKMSKVRVLDGKLQRDSLPLFFPAH
ncbi:hypothetical protein P3X46_017117 [Hevea brasiliensis]|uniref:Uncharacterized protein n=2 Tax=Hevea brasiliensis TaxID=3981 RepID=A0A6A6LBA8_HEVBR|nr:uncharacterized protein LOC110661453 isoform X1 [Hevea brasiliensis]KAF2298731.1 hypothetical protein GH714_026308 [Hevea brasiliensis]KAJ9174045.1 hypothetical protein P3X46_017117 [Hevea brasiliensis]